MRPPVWQWWVFWTALPSCAWATSLQNGDIFSQAASAYQKFWTHHGPRLQAYSASNYRPLEFTAFFGNKDTINAVERGAATLSILLEELVAECGIVAGDATRRGELMRWLRSVGLPEWDEGLSFSIDIFQPPFEPHLLCILQGATLRLARLGRIFQRLETGWEYPSLSNHAAIPRVLLEPPTRKLLSILTREHFRLEIATVELWGIVIGWQLFKSRDLQAVCPISEQRLQQALAAVLELLDTLDQYWTFLGTNVNLAHLPPGAAEKIALFAFGKDPCLSPVPTRIATAGKSDEPMIAVLGNLCNPQLRLSHDLQAAAAAMGAKYESTMVRKDLAMTKWLQPWAGNNHLFNTFPNRATLENVRNQIRVFHFLSAPSYRLDAVATDQILAKLRYLLEEGSITPTRGPEMLDELAKVQTHSCPIFATVQTVLTLGSYLATSTFREGRAFSQSVNETLFSLSSAVEAWEAFAVSVHRILVRIEDPWLRYRLLNIFWVDNAPRLVQVAILRQALGREQGGQPELLVDTAPIVGHPDDPTQRQSLGKRARSVTLLPGDLSSDDGDDPMGQDFDEERAKRRKVDSY